MYIYRLENIYIIMDESTVGGIYLLLKRKKKKVLCSIVDTIIYRYRYINTINIKRCQEEK